MIIDAESESNISVPTPLSSRHILPKQFYLGFYGFPRYVEDLRSISSFDLYFSMRSVKEIYAHMWRCNLSYFPPKVQANSAQKLEFDHKNNPIFNSNTQFSKFKQYWDDFGGINFDVKCDLMYSLLQDNGKLYSKFVECLITTNSNKHTEGKQQSTEGNNQTQEWSISKMVPLLQQIMLELKSLQYTCEYFLKEIPLKSTKFDQLIVVSQYDVLLKDVIPFRDLDSKKCYFLVNQKIQQLDQEKMSITSKLVVPNFMDDVLIFGTRFLVSFMSIADLVMRDVRDLTKKNLAITAKNIKLCSLLRYFLPSDILPLYVNYEIINKARNTRQKLDSVIIM